MPKPRGRKTAAQDPRGPALAAARDTYRRLNGPEAGEINPEPFVFEAGERHVVDVAAMFAELFERTP